MGKIGIVVNLVVNVCFGVVAVVASFMALYYKKGYEDKERMRRDDERLYKDKISCLEKEKEWLKEGLERDFDRYSDLESYHFALRGSIKAAGITFKSGN